MELHNDPDETDLESVTNMIAFHSNIMKALEQKGIGEEKMTILRDIILLKISDYVSNPTPENAENTLGALKRIYLGLVNPENKPYH